MINCYVLLILNFVINTGTIKSSGKYAVSKDSLQNKFQTLVKSNPSPGTIDQINDIAYKLHPIDFIRAFQYSRKAFEISKLIKYTRGEAEALHIIGISFTYGDNYYFALNYQEKAIQLAKKTNFKELLVRAYNAKGVCQSRLNNFKEALKEFNNALLVSKSLPDHYYEGAIIHNVGSLYEKQKKLDAAISFYDQSIKINLKDSNQLWLQQNYFEKSSAFKQKGNFEEASKYAQLSLQKAREIQNPAALVNSFNQVASLFLNFDELDSARYYLNKALYISTQNELYKRKLETLKNISTLHFKDKEYIAAYYTEQNYNKLYDSIYNVNRYRELIEFKTYFDTDLKDRENNELKKRNMSYELTIQNKNYLIFFVVAASLVGLFLTYLLYKSNLNKKRTNDVLANQNLEINKQKQELEELNKMKNKFFSILSHDLRSPLLSLKGIINLFREGQLNEVEMKFLMNELDRNFENTSSLVDNLLTWARGQMSGETITKGKINLSQIFGENINLMKTQYRKKNITYFNHLGSHAVAFADLEMIKMVARNLLSNASKFTPNNGKIEIDSRRSITEIVVKVSDNGIGMTANQINEMWQHKFYTTMGLNNEKGSGLGVMLCKEFIEKNDGKLWVESEPGKGTSFFFSLPLAMD